MVSDDDEARVRKPHLCGPDCNCEFLTRPKLRDQADSKQTHLMMCYMGKCNAVAKLKQCIFLNLSLISFKERCLKAYRDSTRGLRTEIGNLRNVVTKLEERLQVVEKDAKVRAWFATELLQK